MAALTDATAATRELLERTHELRRCLHSSDVEFRSMAFLADDIAERADGLAAMFDEIDEVLMRLPLRRPTETRAELAEEPADVALPDPVGAPVRDERPWLATLLRPVRWLRKRIRGVWQVLGGRSPSGQPEFA